MDTYTKERLGKKQLAKSHRELATKVIMQLCMYVALVETWNSLTGHISPHNRPTCRQAMDS
jgi:hypothetical protein